MIKKQQLNPKHSVFEKKFKQKFEEFVSYWLERLRREESGNRKRRPRVFPVSQKDEELKDIERIKREKAALHEQKRRRQEENRLQKEERQLMRTEDYDVTDFLLKKKNFVYDDEDMEVTEEEDLMDDDTSFFIYKN